MIAVFNRVWVPQVIFVALLVAGWWTSRLSPRQILGALAGWGLAILPVMLMPLGVFWTTAAVALLDVVLVLMVFRGDVRLN